MRQSIYDVLEGMLEELMSDIMKALWYAEHYTQCNKLVNILDEAVIKTRRLSTLVRRLKLQQDALIKMDEITEMIERLRYKKGFKTKMQVRDYLLEKYGIDINRLDTTDLLQISVVHTILEAETDKQARR